MPPQQCHLNNVSSTMPLNNVHSTMPPSPPSQSLHLCPIILAYATYFPTLILINYSTTTLYLYAAAILSYILQQDQAEPILKEDIDIEPDLHFCRSFPDLSNETAFNCIQVFLNQPDALAPSDLKFFIRILLVVPLTTVEVERIFSSMKRYKYDLRNRITNPNLEMRCLLHEPQYDLPAIEDLTIRAQKFIEMHFNIRRTLPSQSRPIQKKKRLHST
ncbi:hypothetical protein BLNAU_23775 [Blattamonas nauphoetae]|uniref:HAT C-terminal dimerisation domain-containing protein n=1 Tax=Blattamonas nauphoetae TaxID=2049346 RepID=A0ABQ9WP93_9EUKA|nr:hypothetical protein BLNAU_23775 [Blattamonas nauphoetae]